MAAEAEERLAAISAQGHVEQVSGRLAASNEAIRPKEDRLPDEGSAPLPQLNDESRLKASGPRPE